MTAAAQTARPAYGRIAPIGLALLAGLVLLVWWTPAWTAWLQAAWFDTYQILKPRSVTSTPVTVVEIDERSLARLGQWPWPRTLLAELLRAIQRHDPAAIGVDILMPEPDRLSPERLLAAARQKDPVLASLLDALPSSDAELARAIGAAPVVLGVAGTHERSQVEPRAPPFLVVDRSPQGVGTPTASELPRFAGALASLPELGRAAAGHGAISAGPTDTVIRRVPLAVRIGDRLVPAIAIEMLRVAVGAPDIRLYAQGKSVQAIAVGTYTVPTEADGQLRLYYSKRDPPRHVSAIDVLDGKVDPVRLQRKLVLVGATGLALVDYQQTPLGERMPGSEVHAQLLENLYDQTWLTRPAWAPWLELAVFVVLGLLLIWAAPRLAPGNAALLAIVCVALPIAAGAAAFAGLRMVFDAAIPALCLLLLFGALLVLSLAEAARQRRALELAIQRQREQAAYVAGELDAARRIQIGFLPSADFRDDPRVEVAAMMTPAREVGGDLYDYFRLDGDRLFFLIGDVSGKGLSASLFMAVGKALYKSITLRSPQSTVSELMRAANDEVSRDNPEMFFVTAFAGTLHLDSGELEYCNAGHDDPYALGPETGRFVRLTEGAGPPLCAVAGFAYRSASRHIQRGELLCLVTDGVFDARNAEGDRYGSERLQAVLAGVVRGETTARALVDAVGADVRTFAQGAESADDLTVLALRWNGPRAVAG